MCTCIACWGTDTSTCNKAGTYSLTDDHVIELFNFLFISMYIGSVVFQLPTVHL